LETIKYEHGVTSLQFDSRKVICASGENGVKVRLIDGQPFVGFGRTNELGWQIYNRTSMQHSTLSTNGHTRPVEKLRYMDRYLLTGGRDATVKIWAL
jgi:division protein 1